jgi:hypothetical protein
MHKLSYLLESAACQFFVCGLRCKITGRGNTVKSAKKRRGRPPKRKGERLSKTRSFRVRGHLEMGLKTAAAKHGRSVSEEIEARLERSFDLDDWLSVFEGSTRAPVIHALAASASLAFWATSSAGKETAYPVLKEATAFIIDTFAGRAFPDHDSIKAELKSLPLKSPELEYKFIGYTVAEEVLRNLGIIARENPPPVATVSSSPQRNQTDEGPHSRTRQGQLVRRH